VAERNNKKEKYQVMSEKDLPEEEYEEGVIELENEDGSKDKFYHMATIEYKGAKYGVFEMVEPKSDDEDGAYIFSMEEDGEDVILNEVEDDDLADAVFQIYLEQAEQYDEEGDEE
jgi:hypothetical protein